jgi:hypothetical protein
LSIYSIIKCVGAGDKVHLGCETFEVIWPKKNICPLGGNYVAELSSMIKEMRGQEFIDHVEEVVNAYATAFIQVYKIFASNAIPESNDAQMKLRDAYDALMKLRIGSVPPKVSKRRDAITSALIKNMNACSIVFHNKQYLALGDVTPKIIKQLPVYEHYTLIKASHHGTKDYYYDKPSTNKYLISNSGIKYAKWKIDERYSPKACCTNTNKERCHNPDSCPYCNISHKKDKREITLNKFGIVGII